MYTSLSFVHGLLVCLTANFVVLKLIEFTGDGYDASTALLDLLFANVEETRLAEIKRLQTTTPSADIPHVLHAWTMIFFGRDAKLVRYMETKRNFMTLDKCL